MKTCEEVLESLYPYLDGEVDEVEIKKIKEHLSACKPCLSRSDFEAALRQHLREKTNHACPDSVKKRIQSLLELY